MVFGGRAALTDPLEPQLGTQGFSSLGPLLALWYSQATQAMAEVGLWRAVPQLGSRKEPWWPSLSASLFDWAGLFYPQPHQKTLSIPIQHHWVHRSGASPKRKPPPNEFFFSRKSTKLLQQVYADSSFSLQCGMFPKTGRGMARIHYALSAITQHDVVYGAVARSHNLQQPKLPFYCPVLQLCAVPRDGATKNVLKCLFASQLIFPPSDSKRDVWVKLWTSF